MTDGAPTGETREYIGMKVLDVAHFPTTQTSLDELISEGRAKFVSTTGIEITSGPEVGQRYVRAVYRLEEP